MTPIVNYLAASRFVNEYCNLKLFVFQNCYIIVFELSQIFESYQNEIQIWQFFL